MKIMPLQTTEDEAVAVNVDHISWLHELPGGSTRLFFTSGQSLDIATPIVDLSRAVAGVEAQPSGASNDG